MEEFLIPVKLLLLGKIKVFLVVWLIRFINVRQNQYVIQMKQIYSFRGHYKIKHIGDLCIHFYNGIFKEIFAAEFAFYMFIYSEI